MNERSLRFVSMLIVFALVLSLVPVKTFAADTSNPVSMWNVSLSDNIGANFYLNLTDPENTTVKFTVDGKVKQYPAAGAQQKYGMYEFSVELPAAQMTEDIRLEVEVNGSSTFTKTYTIKEYADIILKGKYDAETKNMVKAMLHYGAAAQTYFGKNTDKLANAGCDALTPAAIPETEEEVVKSSVTGSVEGIRYYGASLVLENRIAVRYYFKLTKDSQIKDYTFSEGGKGYTPEAKNVLGEVLYYVEIPDIYPQNLDKQYTVTVSKTVPDDPAETLSVTYGPMNYLVRQNKNPSSTERLKTLVSMLYNYYETAKNYANGTYQELQSQITLGTNLSYEYLMDDGDGTVKVWHDLNHDSGSGWDKVGIKFDLSNQGSNQYVKFTYKVDPIQGADTKYQQFIFIYNGNNISLHQASGNSVDEIKNRGCYIYEAGTATEVDFHNIEAGKWYDFYVKVNATGSATDCCILGSQYDYSNATEHPNVTSYMKNIEFRSKLPLEEIKSQITLGASVENQCAYSMVGTDEMVTVWHRNVDESGLNAIHFNTNQFGSADYVKFLYKIDGLSSETAKRFQRVQIGKQGMISVHSGSTTYGTKENVEKYGLYIFDPATGNTIRAQDMKADVWYEICMKILRDDNGDVEGKYSLATMQEGKDNIVAENREQITVHLKDIEYLSDLPFAEIKSQIAVGKELSVSYFSSGSDDTVKVSHNADLTDSSNPVNPADYAIQFKVSENIGNNKFLKFSFKFDSLADASLGQSMLIKNKDKDTWISTESWGDNGVVCFDSEWKERSYGDLQAGQWYNLYVKITDTKGAPDDYYVAFYQTGYTNAEAHPNITAYVKNVGYVDALPFSELQSQIQLGGELAYHYYMDGTEAAIEVSHQLPAADTVSVTFPVAEKIGSNTYLMFSYQFAAIDGYEWNIQINNGEALSLYPSSDLTIEEINAKGLYIYKADGITPISQFQDMQAGDWYTFYVQMKNNAQECKIACTPFGYSNNTEHPTVRSCLKRVQYVNALTEVNVAEIAVDKVTYIQPESSPNYQPISTEGYMTYYFASNGNDNNSGTSESAPFKTVAKANEIIAKAGQTPTRIAFKAGDAFDCEYVAGDPYKKGELYIFGHNAQEATPLIVTTYGETETEKYAKLCGVRNEIVYIGESNTRVSNLELTGEKAKLGVQIYSAWGEKTSKGGAMKNIVVSDCYIHDINVNYTENPNSEIRTAYTNALAQKDAGVFDYMPNPVTDFDGDGSSLDDVRSIVEDGSFTYSTGGIRMGTSSDTTNGPTWFENIWIEDNTIERVARCGMFLSTGWARRPGWDNGAGSYYYDEETGEEKGYYPSRNVVVRRNYLDYTGGDGIVLLNSKGSYVENNTSYHAQYLGRASSTNSQAAYSVPIWLHSCTDVIMQNNEAAYCFMENGCADGQGFDIDIGNRRIIFRYNYSHHNAGGGLLITNRSTYDDVYDKDGNVTGKEWRFIWVEDITVQNNVFAYNGVRVFNIAGPTRNLNISNNTVLLDGKARPTGSEIMLLQSEDMASTGTRAGDWLFANNIFYQLETQPVKFDENWSDACTVRNNVFYNFEDAFFDFGPASTHCAGTRFFNICREDPVLSNTDAARGIENARIIRASAAYLKDFASYELTMQAVDMSGSSAAGLKYVGAFLNP